MRQREAEPLGRTMGLRDKFPGSWRLPCICPPCVPTTTSALKWRMRFAGRERGFFAKFSGFWRQPCTVDLEGRNSARDE